MITSPVLRVALYARVFTLDKGQDPETQLIQLRQYAQRRTFEIIGEFIDLASGSSQERKQYKLMMEVARKRKMWSWFGDMTDLAALIRH